MIRGEVYRSREKEPVRGNKPGYYVVVSRNFVAGSERIATVVCAPVYSEYLGLETEVPITQAEGVDHPSSVRCDFLMLLPKARILHLAGRTQGEKLEALDRALAVAVGLRAPATPRPSPRRQH